MPLVFVLPNDGVTTMNTFLIEANTMKRCNALTKSLAILVVLGFSSSAGAASVSLVPTSPIVGIVAGDIVSFDIVMDFTSDPTIGGGFKITFDPSALQFDSVNRNAAVGDPDFSRDPDFNFGVGVLENGAVGGFNALPDTAVIGSISFLALSSASSIVSITDTSTDLGGPWVSALDFVSFISVMFNQVTLNAPP